MRVKIGEKIENLGNAWKCDTIITGQCRGCIHWGSVETERGAHRACTATEIDDDSMPAYPTTCCCQGGIMTLPTFGCSMFEAKP